MTTEADAKKALMRLLNCHGKTGPELKPLLAAYWSVLSALKAAEIVLVCDRAARGEIGNVRYLPNAGELFQAARPRSTKPPPVLKSGQDRLLMRDGTLFIGTTPYTREEQAAWARGEWPPGIGSDFTAIENRPLPQLTN